MERICIEGIIKKSNDKKSLALLLNYGMIYDVFNHAFFQWECGRQTVFSLSLHENSFIHI